MFFWCLFVRSSYFFYKNDTIVFKKFFLKIAVLKPYFYLDLYTRSSKNFRKVIYSSYFRFGPAGLFSDLKSDFYITKAQIDNELQQRVNKRIKNKDHKKLLNIQKRNSIDANKINYNKYDLILSYEGAVNKEIIKKYPKIKWGIILEDHSNKNFKKFCFFKPKPFDFFINLTQGFTPYSFFRRNHCIDFSYTFGSSNFLKNLNVKKTFKIDVIMEIQQPAELLGSLKLNNLKIEKLNGSLNIKQYIKKLSSSKIFFCPIFTTPRWGNSIIEAALCKNLIIGNKWGYWNSLLIDKDLHCSSIDEGKKIITKVLTDKKIYNYYILKQNKILDEINYKLPLKQIYSIL